ncbi:ClpXP protease specificity-enhancing factor [Undibacterium arcticum]|uniref:ClpXP protease specificity-enhancing factor n=1 Tax=Undibacterium arcticum TaxID=1762892 RepID=A0ABV7FAC4_9BURK
MSAPSTPSTKPYLLRAIYEWCTDSGFTPHIAVAVDAGTRVPMQFVKNGQIVLNISFGATSGLKMDNDAVLFNARFGGVSREIYVPIDNVLAIYANENGQGMAFEMPVAGAVDDDASSDPAQHEAPADSAPNDSATASTSGPRLTSIPSKAPDSKPTEAPKPPDDSPDAPKSGGRPTLTRIK